MKSEKIRDVSGRGRHAKEPLTQCGRMPNLRISLVAAFASIALANGLAVAQDCCTHQGGSVRCPPGLPANSRSLQFVEGGTSWVTPNGSTVFVPQSAFAACGPSPSPAPAPPAGGEPKTPPSTNTPATPASPAMRRPIEPTFPVPPLLSDPGPPAAPPGIPPGMQTPTNVLPGASQDTPSLPPAPPSRTTADQMREMLESLPPSARTAPPAEGDLPTTDEPVLRLRTDRQGLREDFAVSCYRNVRADVRDGNGVIHSGSLYMQLVQASGIANVALSPLGTKVCAACAYDCAGPFFDAAGRTIRVPELPPASATDADLKTWKAAVGAFYGSAFTAPGGTLKLSAGKAALCAAWAQARSAAKPDPSVVQALTDLQQMGGEQVAGIDASWLDNIMAAGAKQGCAAPPALAVARDTSWWLPSDYASTFFARYRDCAVPDVNGVGGCPHPFDLPRGPGNHVNAQVILDVPGGTTSRGATWFVGDP